MAPDAEDFVKLAGHIAESAELARVWSPDEAAWQLRRPGAVVAYRRQGPCCGLITGYSMLAADTAGTRIVLVEDVLWGSLERDDKVSLAKELIARAAAEGARVAVVPVMGYAESDPFRLARFRESSKVLHAYASFWDAGIQVGSTRSFYLDVF